MEHRSTTQAGANAQPPSPVAEGPRRPLRPARRVSIAWAVQLPRRCAPGSRWSRATWVTRSGSAGLATGGQHNFLHFRWCLVDGQHSRDRGARQLAFRTHLLSGISPLGLFGDGPYAAIEVRCTTPSSSLSSRSPPPARTSSIRSSAATGGRRPSPAPRFAWAALAWSNYASHLNILSGGGSPGALHDRPATRLFAARTAAVLSWSRHVVSLRAGQAVKAWRCSPSASRWACSSAHRAA